MIIALAQKELQLLMRDLHGLAVLFLMPLAFVVIMALALPSQQEIAQRTYSISIKDTANNQSSQLLLAFLKRDTQLSHEPTTDTVAVIEITQGFDFNNLDKVKLEISAQTSPVDRLILQQSLQLALAKVNLHQQLLDMELFYPDDPLDARLLAVESQAQLPVISVSSQQASPLPSPVQQSVPSWMIFGMFFIVLPIAQTLLNERNNSTLMRLRSFGLSSSLILVTKLMPYLLINQIQFWLLIAVGIWLVPMLGGEAFLLTGNLLDYQILALAISLTTLSLAALIAVVVKTQEQAVVAGGGLNIILAGLGGIMVPTYMMAANLKAIAAYSPMNWGLTAFHQLLLENKTLAEIGPQLLVMLAFSLIMLLLADRLFQRQYRKLGWNSNN